MVEHRLWEPGVAGSSPVAPRVRSSAGQSRGFLIPRSGVRVPPDPYFIHGWGFSSKVFYGFVGHKLDLPGHGKGNAEYKDFYDLATRIGLSLNRNSVLVGWSLGASLSMLIALLFPQKVKRLILIGATAYFGECWDKKEIRGFFLRLKKEREAFLSEFRRRAYGEFQDSVSLDVLEAMLKDYVELDLRKHLPYIRAEVYLLHGSYDPIVPIRCMLSLYNLLKDAKLYTFPGGHFPAGYEYIVHKILKS